MNWRRMERKWQDAWREAGIFEADPDSRPKKLITVAYPYPNSPQHVGHGRTYTLADIHARFWRMRGYNVLLPMGFHYTGTPILGMARRVADGDPDIMDGLRNVYGVSPQDIERFTDPLSIADHFSAEIELGMKEMGYSIDWRRRFTTIHPAYRRFVAWQINSLRSKSLIRQGSHPVGWCPEDGNPVSQHDTLGDVEPEFAEYTLLKFRWGRHTMPAATLRPETVYGVTNVWVNPDVTYGVWQVGRERWIITEECAQKLAHQGRSVKRLGKIPGQSMVGARVKSPMGGHVPVLPARFVKPDTGTGVVMSVPAHAPFDHAALRTIDPDCAIPSKPIIRVPGYGDDPAAQACEGLDLADEAALEEATETLYNKEFYSGVMMDGCGKFSGRKVSECKDEVRDWMIRRGGQTLMEMSGEVRCRCGALCVVKILEEQWFLDYGDESWKGAARRCLDGMEITPPEIRGEFHNVVDWLRERACARQRGLGTRLPWDRDWIVESLTDSTIYTAMYTIMKYVNDGSISPEEMDGAFFDYVFLGIGEPSGAAARAAREEFLYYYPVDARHSGRDLVPNHLTFFVMNHTALFPEEHWPRRIVVNGSVLMDGKKMSKSMGNIVPLRGAIRKHGADPIRLGIAMSSELLQDADINLESVSGMGAKLERMIRECARAGRDAPRAGDRTPEDAWMLSKIYSCIKSVTANMEKMRMREALHDVLYGLERDVQWYGRRLEAQGRDVPRDVSCKVLDARARLLAPFAPHAAEEMWSSMGNSGLVSAAPWPEAGPIRADIIHDEDYMASVLGDISNIVRVSGITPGRIRVYAAESHEAYNAVLECVTNGDADMRGVMARISGDRATRHLRRRPKEIAACLKDILAENVRTRRARLDRDADERALLAGRLADVVRMEYDCEVLVYGSAGASEADDPGGKARLARAYHPAIYIEE